MKSQVTTKKGDLGTTRTLAGDVLSKADPVIECSGWLDALRAHIALLRLNILQQTPEDHEQLADFLLWLLHCFFLIGAEVNDPSKKKPKFRYDIISPKHLEKLETEQRRLEDKVRLPHAFIVSAATELAAEADVATTAARTFERSLVRLKEAVPEFEAAALLAFMNRLSDYLFILARHLDAGHYHIVDYSRLDRE